MELQAELKHMLLTIPFHVVSGPHTAMTSKSRDGQAVKSAPTSPHGCHVSVGSKDRVR